MERNLETVRSRKLAEWYEILKSGHCMVRRRLLNIVMYCRALVSVGMMPKISSMYL